ncbi:hypothetical protein C7974DRAFT_131891 [Boeremia exigua]|uniref:uncharacterized protein n=1 Tax=Boeremia exigua TaxID=749465 RepID=UPI001E8D4640|nr:uncharacterized protein C7974DRAFT_131891 [Boeremia exigua]KAH6639450.1 hypothetical protein C7974DRAFT_131891 [Boeremia exigua]
MLVALSRANWQPPNLQLLTTGVMWLKYTHAAALPVWPARGAAHRRRGFHDARWIRRRMWISSQLHRWGRGHVQRRTAGDPWSRICCCWVTTRSGDWERARSRPGVCCCGFGGAGGQHTGRCMCRDGGASKNSIDRTQSRATASECCPDAVTARIGNKHILERSYHCCSISTRTLRENNPIIDCPKMMYYFQTRKIQRSNASNRCRGRNGSN